MTTLTKTQQTALDRLTDQEHNGEAGHASGPVSFTLTRAGKALRFWPTWGPGIATYRALVRKGLATVETETDRFGSDMEVFRAKVATIAPGVVHAAKITKDMDHMTLSELESARAVVEAKGRATECRFERQVLSALHSSIRARIRGRRRDCDCLWGGSHHPGCASLSG